MSGRILKFNMARAVSRKMNATKRNDKILYCYLAEINLISGVSGVTAKVTILAPFSLDESGPSGLSPTAFTFLTNFLSRNPFEKVRPF